MVLKCQFQNNVSNCKNIGLLKKLYQIDEKGKAIKNAEPLSSLEELLAKKLYAVSLFSLLKSKKQLKLIRNTEIRSVMINWITVKWIGNLIKFDSQTKTIGKIIIIILLLAEKEKEKESVDIVKETVMIKIKTKANFVNVICYFCH